jgi:hypothetical protein
MRFAPQQAVGSPKAAALQDAADDRVGFRGHRCTIDACHWRVRPTQKAVCMAWLDRDRTPALFAMTTSVVSSAISFIVGNVRHPREASGD